MRVVAFMYAYLDVFSWDTIVSLCVIKHKCNVMQSVKVMEADINA